jgi:hypothetical protein
MLYVVPSKQEGSRSQPELFDAVYCPAEYLALWLPSGEKINLLAGSSCLLQVIEMLVLQCVRC